MNPNVTVEVYDPAESTGVKQVELVCGSFTVDAGVLVVYRDAKNQQPTALFASGEWRRMSWL